jgi:release factor family 2
MNVRFLRRLYERPGPWVSIYLDTSMDSADAREAIALRWRELAGQVTAAGADRDTVAALDAAVREHTGTGRCGLALFAGTGEVALRQPLPEPPAQPVARVGTRPDVLPLLAGLGEHVSWLRVLVDRSGADLELHAGRIHRTVPGTGRYPVRKAAPGGWSQPKYQHSAEVTWLENAKEVAEELAHAVDETGPDVVILAGDVRARQLLAEHLPPAVADRVVQTDAGSRAAGSDPGPLDEATERAVRELVARRYAETLDAYRAGLAHGLAVAGLAAVRTPLDWAQVQTLLISPDLPEELADELIEAAVRGDAEVLPVTPEQESLPDGVGAVLRYPLVEGEQR